MLKRPYRLPAGSRLQKPAVRPANFFLLKMAQNALSYSRFGFIIPKKVAPLAVDRNRSKRLIRSCVEALLFDIKPADYLFIIKQNLSEIKREEIEKEVRQVLGLSQ